MSKPKTTKKATKKTAKKTSPPKAKGKTGITTRTPAKEKAPKEDLCVFAFRLTPAERDLIHQAAGPGKASKFVRNLAVLASRGDEATVSKIVKGVHQTAS